MRWRFFSLISLLILMISSSVFAQTIHPITLDEDVLVDLTGDQASAGYSITTDAPTSVTVNVRYLGAAFPVRIEAFDATGQPTADQTVSAVGDTSLQLAAGESFIVVSATTDTVGRAILRFSAGQSNPTQATLTPEVSDPLPPAPVTVTGWQVLGDATASGDSQVLCSVPNSFTSDWIFDAPQEFVDQVVAGYGETLAFDMSRRDAIQTPASLTVYLVVGNGILLAYEAPDSVTDQFTRFEITLDETGGWFDVDGMFDTTDAGMFQQMLSDVTRVQIFATGFETDGFCIQNPTVGADSAGSGTDDNATTPDGTIDYYVISSTDTGDGLAIGCDGFLVPQDTGIPFSDDPAENIRTSLEPLLAMPTTETGNGFSNLLGGQGLSINQIDIDGSHATIVIDGSFLFLGACADPQIEAQFVLSALIDPRIESATIIANGENLKAMADMSGMTAPDAVYTRDDLRERDW